MTGYSQEHCDFVPQQRAAIDASVLTLAIATCNAAIRGGPALAGQMQLRFRPSSELPDGIAVEMPTTEGPWTVVVELRADGWSPLRQYETILCERIADDIRCNLDNVTDFAAKRLDLDALLETVDRLKRLTREVRGVGKAWRWNTIPDRAEGVSYVLGRPFDA